MTDAGAVADPQLAELAAALAPEPLNLDLIDPMIGSLGIRAAPILLEALAESGSSKSRYRLLVRIQGLGDGVGMLAAERLGDDRWFVQRNMLALLAQLSSLPPGFNPEPHLHHADARVRREALRVALRMEDIRERSMALGMRDSDDHAVRLALTAAQRGCPESLLPLVAELALKGGNTDQRVTAIGVLAGSGNPAAIDTLLVLTQPRRTLFGRRSPRKTPEYLAALTGLRAFVNDERVLEVLDRARRSHDPQVLEAVGGTAQA